MQPCRPGDGGGAERARGLLAGGGDRGPPRQDPPTSSRELGGDVQEGAAVQRRRHLKVF